MKIYISNLNINDLQSKEQFMQVQVSFYDELAHPHHCADGRVFLKKDQTKTLGAIKKDAIQEAVKYLKLILADRS
jgi:hypothetical protein